VTMSDLDPGYQLLVCRYLRDRLDALAGELHAVRCNEEIEPVHQARVASRRIRAALRMFADCFEPETLAGWERQIKRLTKELGAARDKDIQIEFIREFLCGPSGKDPRHRPGVERLLLRLTQSRAAMQPGVLAVLDRLDRKRTLAQIYGRLEEMLFSIRSQETDKYGPYVREMAAAHIRDRRTEFSSCEPALEDPANARGHHQLRIAAKKLRYALEICAPAYDGQLAPVIRMVRQVQSFLGDIHDCDVWTQDIDRFMDEEQRATTEYYGQSRPFNRLRPGLLSVREERLNHRRLVFQQLIEYRKTPEVADAWKTLDEALQSTVAASGAPGGQPQDRQIDGGQEQVAKNRVA